MSFAMARPEAAARAAELSALAPKQFSAHAAMHQARCAPATAADGPLRAVAHTGAGSDAVTETANTIAAS